jgi:hypothetical protein
MDRPFDSAYITQTQPEMGGAGGGGKTRIGLFDGGAADDSPGSLATRVLSAKDLIPLIRELEHSALVNGARSALVYWSTHSASGLLPHGSAFRDLFQTAHCVSIFSEDLVTLPDVSVVCVFSEQGSAFIEMHRYPESDSYRCFGSINTNRTVARMKGLFDRFWNADFAETNRLVGQLELLPFNSTNNVYSAVYRKWMSLPFAPEPY